MPSSKIYIKRLLKIKDKTIDVKFLKATTTKTKHKVKGGLFLDVIVKLLTSKYQPLEEYLPCPESLL